MPPHVEVNGIDALSRCTPAEIAALKEYTGGDFATINKAQRKCPPDFQCVEGNSRKVMEAVESAIAKAKPFKEPVALYRGLTMRTDMANAIFASAQENIKSGKEFTMPSLTSTSTSPGRMVKDFTTSSGPAVTSVVFEIKAKTGLYVESITGVPGEKEVIQSAKTRYRVAAVEEVDFQMKAGPMRRTVIRLEEI